MDSPRPLHSPSTHYWVNHHVTVEGNYTKATV